MDVTEQRQVSIVLLARRRNLLGSFKRLRIEAFAEIRISQIKFHVVGIRIGVQGRLEMLNGIVVQTVASQQYARAGLCPVVTGAELIKLRDCFSRVFEFAQFQIRFGQQIEILRLIRMFLNLLRQLCQIQLRPRLR